MIVGGFIHPFNKEKLIDLVYFSERQGRTPVAVFREEDGSMFRSNVAELLLMPLAWEAVGRTRGWFKYTAEYSGNPEDSRLDTVLQYHMHLFIDQLIDGLSIEEALTKLK